MDGDLAAAISITSGTETLFTVEAVHRDWAGAFLLDEKLRRVRVAPSGACGTYIAFGDDIEIVWDTSRVERFRRHEGRFVHVERLAPRIADALSAPSQEPIAKPKARVAIVTAYYKETRALIERCIASVRRQTVAADHIMVADGFAQDWIDVVGARHIRLDRSHGDYGNTPRGIGSLLAIAEDYDAIAFLDADNWFEPHHIELALTAARDTDGGCDYVIARRNMMRPNETIMPIADEPIEKHVDTNCFVFLPGSFHLLQNFALVPNKLSGIGDRIFFAGLQKQQLRSAVLAEKTVNYHCIWASLYQALGEAPPEGAKPNIDQTPMKVWLTGLDPAQRQAVNRRTNGVI